MIKIGNKRFGIIAIVLLCIVHTAILSWHACVHSPTIDELGHLPSGLINWSGRFDAYRVNPPLVRMIAAIPIVFSGERIEFHTDESQGDFRAEWSLAYELYGALGERIVFYFAAGRIVLIPISLLGLIVCWRWSTELRGEPAGVISGCLWCFSPCVLGHGAMITPDVAATSFGVFFFYRFWKWLDHPNFAQTIWMSLAMTLCFLSKFTWLVLIPCLVSLIVLSYFGWSKRPIRTLVGPCLICMVITLYFVNAMYAFDGFGMTLRQLSPISRSFQKWADVSVIGSIPIPFPKDLVLGIDLQRMEFENKMWSYLLGEWRLGGWWHYYLVALALKTPLGLWPLLAIRCCSVKWRRWYTWFRNRDFLCVVIPPIAIVAMVSSQTGFNHHLRYILPAYPFLFIIASQTFSDTGNHWNATNRIAALCTGLFVLSSLLVVPHSLSYFNESIGGPKNGHYYLGNSNIDWGQDVLLLMQWEKQNPHISIDAYELAYPIPLLGGNRVPTKPQEGWYALSVNSLHDRLGAFSYFLEREPYARIGYSIHIYHIEAAKEK